MRDTVLFCIDKTRCNVKIQQIETRKLKLNPKNPRRNDAAVDIVVKSIEKYGFKNPIITDTDLVVYCGNTRLKAARKLKLDHVPVIVADDLTPEQIREYALLDNKSGEIAEWDLDLLKDELAELDFSDFDIDWGIPEQDEKKDIIEDEPPEVDQDNEPICKIGDVWQLGAHRLMCGDATDKVMVERLMDGAKADMVFTDPPWNVNYGDVKEKNAQGYKPRKILNDFMGTEEFKRFMNSAFSCMNGVSKDGAMTYVVMSAQEWGNMMLTLAMNKYHWSSTIIWNKDSIVLSRKDYHTKYEPIWYGWKEGTRLCPLLDRKQSDVWDIARPKKSVEHPTMKPIALVAKAINNSSRRGDIVLDLFGGSGSTLIACEQLNRVCYMCELDPKYCDVIIKRYENLTGQKAVKINV